MASSDTATIQKWGEENPDCNWAVATGPGSGVFVLDVDGEVGRESLAALEATQRDTLPPTFVSHTGRDDGGEHRWFVYPADQEIRTRAGYLGRGLDIRAVGGYVIVPPSIHPTGRTYQWARPLQPIADAPSWLLDLLIADARQKSQPPIASFYTVFKGQRNIRLTSWGGALRGKGAEHAEIEAELLAANLRWCRPPLPDEEVCRIAASVARYQPNGPDPLERAWQAMQRQTYSTDDERFLALCCHLQDERPEQSIVLPLVRIGLLMDLHPTTVGLYRKAAVKDGILKPDGQYIPHRRAGRYWVVKRGGILTKPSS